MYCRITKYSLVLFGCQGKMCLYSEISVIVMVFNTTFNNISAMSLRSVLLVEEPEIFGENHRPVANH